jgi:hypothetical protein
MSILFALLAAGFLAALIFVLLENKKIEMAAGQEIERQRQNFEAETTRIYREAQAAVGEAQKLIDRQVTDLRDESERVRQHYEAEARKAQEASDALVVAKTAEMDSLRKYERLRDAEAEVGRQVSEAIGEAAALREQAEALMARARETAAEERLAAEDKDMLHRQFLAGRWNKKNFGKEFFRVSLKEIRGAVEKLAQDKGFADGVSWRETEAGRAAEWKESRDIEQNVEAKQRWLVREQAAGEERWRKRQRRLAIRGGLSVLGLPGSDSHDADAVGPGASVLGEEPLPDVARSP